MPQWNIWIEWVRKQLDLNKERRWAISITWKINVYKSWIIIIFGEEWRRDRVSEQHKISKQNDMDMDMNVN